MLRQIRFTSPQDAIRLAQEDPISDAITPIAASEASTAGPEAGGAASARARRWLAAAAWVAGFAVVFVLNLRLSQTMASNSDSAGPVLEGWDMLHGNILQHGWITADVPYYPTEVTEDALVVLVRGLNSDAVHWGGALTYTLAMLFAALLAMGRRGEGDAPARRQRLAMGAIAAGIMLAPQLAAGTYTLLLGPDHFGTAVPVLLSWLILDRSRPRWHVPVLVALILSLASVADLTTVFIGAAPLAAGYAYRVAGARLRERLPLASQRHEIALVAAGLLAGLMGVAGQRILTAIGSLYHVAPATQLSPLHLIFWHNFQVTGECLLILAGADFIGVHQPAQVALAMAHLAGVVLGGAGILLAAWRFARDKDVISQLLVAGIFLNLLTFVVGTHSVEISYAREITPVLSLGAVLAGRLLTRRLLALRLTPVLIVVLCGYLAGFGYEIRQPVAPAQNEALVPLLKGLHLTSGLSGYWAADDITLDTGGQIVIRSLNRADGKVIPSEKLNEPAWYDPRRESADFVVLYRGTVGTPPFNGFTGAPGFNDEKEVLATFGPPARTYHDGQYTILVWNKNLLADLTVRLPAGAVVGPWNSFALSTRTGYGRRVAVDFSRFQDVLRSLGAAGPVRAFAEATPTAAAAAAQLGCDVGAIANSLVFAADGEPLLVMTSGAHRVDTARVAKALGVSSVDRADAKSVRAWTGQVIGGVGPVGHPAPIRTLVDNWLARYEVVWAAAGHPHTVFPTSFAELLRITGGTAADVGG